MRELIIFLLIFTLSGCVGNPIHKSVTYSSMQSIIKKNNEAIFNLKIGMSPEEVKEVVGNPERSEGYPGGSVWLYRTAMRGIYETADSDFTPLVFDLNQKLVGWGRIFYTERIKRYENTIKD